jgi:hypothetical protein
VSIAVTCASGTVSMHHDSGLCPSRRGGHARVRTCGGETRQVPDPTRKHYHSCMQTKLIPQISGHLLWMQINARDSKRDEVPPPKQHFVSVPDKRIGAIVNALYKDLNEKDSCIIPYGTGVGYVTLSELFHVVCTPIFRTNVSPLQNRLLAKTRATPRTRHTPPRGMWVSFHGIPLQS